MSGERANRKQLHSPAPPPLPTSGFVLHDLPTDITGVFWEHELYPRTSTEKTFGLHTPAAPFIQALTLDINPDNHVEQLDTLLMLARTCRTWHYALAWYLRRNRLLFGGSYNLSTLDGFGSLVPETSIVLPLYQFWSDMRDSPVTILTNMRLTISADAIEFVPIDPLGTVRAHTLFDELRQDVQNIVNGITDVPLPEMDSDPAASWRQRADSHVCKWSYLESLDQPANFANFGSRFRIVDVNQVSFDASNARLCFSTVYISPRRRRHEGVEGRRRIVRHYLSFKLPDLSGEDVTDFLEELLQEADHMDDEDDASKLVAAVQNVNEQLASFSESDMAMSYKSYDWLHYLTERFNKPMSHVSPTDRQIAVWGNWNNVDTPGDGTAFAGFGARDNLEVIYRTHGMIGRRADADAMDLDAMTGLVRGGIYAIAPGLTVVVLDIEECPAHGCKMVILSEEVYDANGGPTPYMMVNTELHFHTVGAPDRMLVQMKRRGCYSTQILVVDNSALEGISPEEEELRALRAESVRQRERERLCRVEAKRRRRECRDNAECVLGACPSEVGANAAEAFASLLDECNFGGKDWWAEQADAFSLG